MPDHVAVCRELVADLQPALTSLHVHIVRAADGEGEVLEHAGRQVASLLERVQAAAVGLDESPAPVNVDVKVHVDGKAVAEGISKRPGGGTAKKR